jgi:hypothetical protein
VQHRGAADATAFAGCRCRDHRCLQRHWALGRADVRRPRLDRGAFDSASSFLRATALYLKGKDFPAWGLTGALKSILPLANYLPQQPREILYAAGGMNEGLAPSRTSSVDANKFAEWAAGLYPTRPYPGVTIGSSNGALTHLAAALGMPWLPQTIFVLVRQTDVHPDDAIAGLEAGREPGKQLLEANPEIQLHHMHDPIQDRLMLQLMTYFRIKWLELPEAYQAFMRQNLAPGDPIIIVDCKRRWPVTRVGDRHLFQFGPWGAPPRRTSSRAASGSVAASRSTSRTAASGSRRSRPSWRPRRSGASSRRYVRQSSDSPPSTAIASSR